MLRKFLQKTQRFLNVKEPVCIVLGNESCDLDSAVCAVSLSYYYQHLNVYGSTTKAPKLLRTCNFLPVLNIPRRDFALKTEVLHAFQRMLMNSDAPGSAIIDYLTFSDDLQKDFLERSQFVLVDHHQSPWLKQTVAIYDHRPYDNRNPGLISRDCEIHIEQVGSCATLIAELLLKDEKLLKLMKCPVQTNDTNTDTDRLAFPVELLQLLRSAIVLDTVNFSKEAARVTAKDINICSMLEDWLRQGQVLDLPDRDSLFDELVKARADIQQLSASQLLRKDMKILNQMGIQIAMPGFPITVEQYLKKYQDQAKRAIEQLAQELSCDVMVLIGLYINPEDNSVHRDLGLINLGQGAELCELVQQRLLNMEEPALKLQTIEILNTERKESFMSGHFYRQNNLRATRKHILPVVKQALEDYCQRIGRTSLSHNK